MKLFGAYIHTKPNNVPFYVGKGRIERAKRLDASHHNLYHNRIVAKYGKENIGVAFIPCSSEKIAFQLEIGIIKCLKRSGVKLANITDGGEGASGAKSPQHLQKLRASLKGRKGTMFGKKHRQESIEKMSLAHIGNTYRKGFKCSPSSIKKMSASAKLYFSLDANRQKQRSAAKSQMKPVFACGNMFESIHAYCNYVKKPLSTVSRWVKNNWQDKIDTSYLEINNAC